MAFELKHPVLRLRPSHEKRQYWDSIAQGLQYGVLWAPERLARNLLMPLNALLWSIISLAGTLTLFALEIPAVIVLGCTGRLYFSQSKPIGKSSIT